MKYLVIGAVVFGVWWYFIRRSGPDANLLKLQADLKNGLAIGQTQAQYAASIEYRRTHPYVIG